MRLPQGPEFAEERERYRFRFCCEDCAHLASDGACAHGWPQEDHQLQTYEAAPRELVFCKEFELA